MAHPESGSANFSWRGLLSQKLSASATEQPFDRWLREQLQRLPGWNLQEGLPGQARALIYDEGGDATLFQ